MHGTRRLEEIIALETMHLIACIKSTFLCQYSGLKVPEQASVMLWKLGAMLSILIQDAI